MNLLEVNNIQNAQQQILVQGLHTGGLGGDMHFKNLQGLANPILENVEYMPRLLPSVVNSSQDFG